MQLKEALSQGIEVLEKARVPSPRITAEVLLMHAARCDRTHLHAHPERQLTNTEWVHYGRYLNERMSGKPTQYITGHQEFWGMDFEVNSGVLIPRPETELLVETAVAMARRCANLCGTFTIADVGTGSGCIAVALASELPQAKIYALDRSTAALDVARRNAKRHGVEARISFLLSDLLNCSGEALTDLGLGPLPLGRGSDLHSWQPLPPLQMIVSNPPYVGERDLGSIQREVREFEPREALFAGESGDEVYSRLIPQAAESMQAGGYLVLELGYDSAEAVRRLLALPEWDAVRWLPDLAGIARVVTAWRAPAEPR